MRPNAALSLCISSVLLTGCLVTEDATPSVEAGAKFASAFVFRGQTNVDRPVIQPNLRVSMDAIGDTFIQASMFGNIDAQNNTGSAWFPDGHAGKFTEVDLGVSIGKSFFWEEADMGVTLTAGVETYILPNGLEFPFGERGNTSEVVLAAEFDILETNPYVVFHYDFDEVDGTYTTFGIREQFPLGLVADSLGAWAITLDGSISYTSSAEANWLYGLDEAGFADLRGSMVLTYDYDDRTQFNLGIHGSTIVDNTLDEWFTTLANSSSAFGANSAIADDVIWATLGVTWVF